MGSFEAATLSTNTREWKLARRTLLYGERTLIMGILNMTPDSFSDGGQFFSSEKALAHAEEMVADGADLIDIGGESTRPSGAHIPVDEEIRRVVPMIEILARTLPVPISIDTTKSAVAREALDAGAEIVNDISALRFDPQLAEEVARAQAGLVLMHSRGTPETLHQLPPVGDIFTEVIESLRGSVMEAERRGVQRASLAVDPGFGFGKSQEQNVELIARLERIARAFKEFPFLIGTSRKRFIGALLCDAPVDERLHGTMATITTAVLHGAHIVRVHDVKAAVETVRIADAIKHQQ